MFYGAFKGQVYPLAKALEQYYDIHLLSIHENSRTDPFEIELPQGIKDIEGIEFNFHHYDIFCGFDTAALKTLGGVLREKTNKPMGATILDIPYHHEQTSRYYHEGMVNLWKQKFEYMKSMDFMISWRSYAKHLGKDKFDGPMCILFAPTKPVGNIVVEEEKEFEVVYSGAIRAEKGLHLVLLALELLNKPPKFTVVGAGPVGLEKFAKYLGLRYEAVQCSEREKYYRYANCELVVSYPTIPYIPPLSPLEAISIGKIPIVTDYPEFRRLYGEYATYVKPEDPKELAIVFAERLNNDIPEEISEEAISFWRENRTYDVYAKQLHAFFEESGFPA